MDRIFYISFHFFHISTTHQPLRTTALWQTQRLQLGWCRNCISWVLCFASVGTPEGAVSGKGAPLSHPVLWCDFTPEDSHSCVSQPGCRWLVSDFSSLKFLPLKWHLEGGGMKRPCHTLTPAWMSTHTHIHTHTRTHARIHARTQGAGGERCIIGATIPHCVLGTSPYRLLCLCTIFIFLQ